jgi:hypothetical protein
METPPGFNPDHAIAAWREELARQPGLTPADLRELEAHLRDGFAELRKNPIREEEAFLLARLRVGPPKPVAFEFAKANPERVWAPRVFWLVFGVFAYQLWLPTINVLNADLFIAYTQFLGLGDRPRSGIQEMFGTIILELGDVLIYVVPVLLAAIWLARGVPRFVARPLSSRRSVAWVGLGMFLLPLAIRTLFIVIQAYSQHGRSLITDPMYFEVDRYGFGNQAEFILLNFFWPVCLIVLMVWLTPSRAEAKARPSLA